jgi:hypothetical protein
LGDTITTISFFVSSVINAVAQTNGSSTSQTLVSPTMTSPALGTPASGVMTNVTSVPAAQLTGSQAIPRSTLPTGSVLQVVNATYSTIVSSSTNTFVDTGLTATITPTSATSKILVSVSQNGLQKRTNTAAYTKIIVLRGATVIGTPAVTAGYTGNTDINHVASASGAYLDSPATTSATVYKTQFRSEGNAASVQVQGDSEDSTITLMEISA